MREPGSSQGEAGGSKSRWEQGCCVAGCEEGGGAGQEPREQRLLEAR